MLLQKTLNKIFHKIKYYGIYKGRLIEKVKELRLSNRFQEAEAIIVSILDKQPTNFFALAEYAQIAYDQEKYQDSAIRWEKAITLFDHTLLNQSTYILKAAEAYLANQWTAKAKSLILPFQHISSETSLGLANCSLDNQKEWIKWVNRFLALNGLDEITPPVKTVPAFIDLFSSPRMHFDGQPKVSIIMTAYNIQDYIGVAVRSILEQSWNNFELLIFNDASTDQTPSIINEFMHKDPRIRVFHNHINIGTYACRNIALDLCTGEFITAHDSDDWAHPDRIKIQVESLRTHPNIIGNLTRSVRLYENGKFELTAFGTYTSDRCCTSLMFRSDIVRRTFGYWDSVRVSADREFIDRITTILGKKAIKTLPQPLIFMLRRRNSLTTIPATLGVSGRISPLRQQYQEAYEAWHKLINKNNCRLPFPMSVRSFYAPPEIIVPSIDVNECLVK